MAEAGGEARHLPRKLFTYFVDHWIIAGLIPPLPGLLGLGIKVSGIHVSPWLFSIGILVIVLAIAFSLLKSRAVKYELTVRNNNDYVLGRLMKATNAVTRTKFERFAEFLRHKTCPLPEHPFEEITQPEAQIRAILENLQHALVDIHGMEQDRVGVSVACEHDGKWRWIVRLNSEDDLELDVLTTDTQCSFHRVMVAKTEAFLFHADKRKGIRSNTYKQSTRDGDRPIGSIIVHRLDLPVDGNTFSAGLSVSTYGMQLCEESDHEAKEKIRGTLLPCFETRLRLELCLYYVKYVMMPRSPSVNPRISRPTPVPLAGESIPG